MNLRDVAEPPDDYGNRSSQGFGKKAALAIFEEMKKEAAETLSPLKKFLQAEGMDKFEKLGSAVANDFEFAQKMMELVPTENWLDADIPATMNKSASAKNGLTLHIGQVSYKSASILKKSYEFIDERLESDIDPIYEPLSQNFTNATEPGIYDVIFGGGEVKRALVLPYEEKYLAEESHCDKYDYPADTHMPYQGPNMNHTKIIFELDGDKAFKKVESKYDGEVYGELVDDDLDTIIKSEANENKGYFLFDRISKCVTGPFYVTDKKTANGITTYSVKEYGWGEPKLIKVNPDYTKNNYESGVFNDETIGFIQVGAKMTKGDSKMDSPCCDGDLDFNRISKRLGDPEDFLLSLYEGGYKSASVMADTIEDSYVVTSCGQTVNNLNEIGVKALLMKEASCSENAVQSLLDTVSENNRADFFMKKEAMILDSGRGDLFSKSLNEYGVLEDDENFDVLEGESVTEKVNQDSPEVLRHEAENKAEEQMTLTATPAQLAEFAQSSGQRHVFEHGVVGQLAKTYDSNDLVSSYLDDLLQGLDKLGRILFLIYWKPEDFAERYGDDDITTMENMLVSSFKSYGETVLELIKRNPDFEENTVSVGT